MLVRSDWNWSQCVCVCVCGRGGDGGSVFVCVCVCVCVVSKVLFSVCYHRQSSYMEETLLFIPITTE